MHEGRHNPHRDTKAFDRWFYPGHTLKMKTAISLPDALYSEAKKIAQNLGIPRSQLFARALEEFIEHHKRENVTERLNRVYSRITDESGRDIENAEIESIRTLTQNDSW